MADGEHLATEVGKIQAGVPLAKIRKFATELLRPFSSSPALDADLILAKVCHLSRLNLITETGRAITAAEREALVELFLRRAKAEPIAYILGEKEFYGLTFKVNRDVLIPRPDTELLVEAAVLSCQQRLASISLGELSTNPEIASETRQSRVGERQGDGLLRYARNDGTGARNDGTGARNDGTGARSDGVGDHNDDSRAASVKIIDVCTGSGCIAITIAHELKNAQIIATDLSSAALEIARENAATNRVEERIEFRQGDLLEPCAHEEGIDLIVSNPPYIRPDDMADLMPDVRDFEPHLALMGTEADGLGLIRKIMAQAKPILRAGGTVMMEIGQGQAEILAGVHFEGFSPAKFLKDYAGIWRVVTYNRVPSAQKIDKVYQNG